MIRRKTREIQIGNTKIGGNNPILIQSMCTTDTRNSSETIAQINKLAEVGCEIIRVAVPDMEACNALKDIKKGIGIPLVADIHFDYRLALKAIENGVDKIRINPGNIGSEDRIQAIVNACKEKNIPIRIGVNSGSLEKDLVDKYGGVTSEGLVESAIKNIRLLERFNYENIVVSLKSSSVPFSIKAYNKLSENIDYPLHLGITESGTMWTGSIKSAIGIGSILSNGIGDTIRVSLTCDPIEEIKTAKEILKSLGLRRFGVEFVSCPTCGRTEIDLISIAEKVEMVCQGLNKNIKVAVMGCAVNGPGEAKDADIGIAGGKGYGIIFKKGEIIKKVKEDELISTLLDELHKF